MLGAGAGAFTGSIIGGGLFVMSLYLGILGLIGGAIGGAFRKP
jgi:hypothetical protein